MKLCRAVDASTPAATPSEKLVSIQLLRALAAGVVAVLHIAFAFADHIGSGLGVAPAGGLAGQGAVMLFFVISGYVMVISSRTAFGDRTAPGRFWLRRIIRIMPAYWLASGLLAAIFLTIFPQPIDPANFLRSLVLVPFWPEQGGMRAIPFLWVGWTLFYEMMFYFWFGLFLVWERGRAIAAVIAVLIALIIAGEWIVPDTTFLFTLTRPVSVMFMAGMGLALWRETGGRGPVVVRLVALGAMLLAIMLVPQPAEPDAMGLDYVLWCGLPAFLLAFAVLSGPLRLPARQLVSRAGDISYALYLLHVPTAWLWLWLWPKVMRRTPLAEAGPWDYLISAVVVAVLVAWLFFTFVERPMTLALNRWLLSPHRREARLAEKNNG